MKKSAKDPSKDDKISAIIKIEKELSELDHTLGTADTVFKTLQISHSLIKSIANDKPTTGNLIADIVLSRGGFKKTNPNKIPNVGYTKAVLWLHGCGVGNDFAPDNNHTIGFLNECGLPGTRIREDYYVIISYVNKVVNEVNQQTNKNYSVRDASYCIYLYRATRNLVKKGYKKYFDPSTLLAFMNDQNCSIGDLENYLYNIELVGDLEVVVNDFMDRTFNP